MPRSLEQWLASQSQLHPRTIDLGLDRLRRVQSRLGWRQPAVPVITVAGTVAHYAATGTVCATNPVALVVPCHRVLRSDGTLGNFGGGLAMKDALLRLEGVLL